MKKLKNSIVLSGNVKIYVPRTESTDEMGWTDRAMELLADKFGGATATAALGAWVTVTGKLIKEHVTIVYAFADQENLVDGIDAIYDFCVAMKKELDQEAVALEVNGELHLI